MGLTCPQSLHHSKLELPALELAVRLQEPAAERFDKMLEGKVGQAEDVSKPLANRVDSESGR